MKQKLIKRLEYALQIAKRNMDGVASYRAKEGEFTRRDAYYLFKGEYDQTMRLLTELKED